MGFLLWQEYNRSLISNELHVLVHTITPSLNYNIFSKPAPEFLRTHLAEHVSGSEVTELTNYDPSVQ